MKKLDLEHILHSMRDRINGAIENDDRELLARLATASTILFEASNKSPNKETWLIMMTMRNVAHKGSMGLAEKEKLPTHEDISGVFET